MQIANVTSQYTSMGSTDVGNVLGAFVADHDLPYATNSPSIVLTEVTVDNSGVLGQLD